MAYKSIGTFDTDALFKIYDDPTPFFEAMSENAHDIAVMEVGNPDEETTELWHDDYDEDEGAWIEAGEFEDYVSAQDATRGFPEGEAVGVFDYSDGTAKLMIRKSGDD